jgi:DNA-binding transcriptional ArsR family regulator
MIPSDGEAALERRIELLKALANPIRYRVVLELSGSPRTVTAIARRLGVPPCIVSQQLRVLRSCGIVRGVRHGGFSWYEVIEEDAEEIVKVLDAPNTVTDGPEPRRRARR